MPVRSRAVRNPSGPRAPGGKSLSPLPARGLAILMLLLLLAAPTFHDLLAEGRRIRLMAANTTSGTEQSYEGPGIRMFQAFEPDVILLQEFNHLDSSPEAIAELVRTAFGPEYHYVREDEDVLPNGIVSRFPILEHGQWEDSSMGNRDFIWARIDVPGPRDLWAVSVHLKAGRARQDREKRTFQMRTIAESARATIPESDLLVVGGDFNTQHAGEPGFTHLDDILVQSGPFPADGAGNPNTNSRRTKPYDWLLADPDLEALATPVKIGERVFPYGLVFDSRHYSPITDLAPVEPGDSQVEGMQHMPVIRDFLIPVGEAEAGAPSASRTIH